MKVALIMGNFCRQGFPPLGVLYLASYLKKYSPETDVRVFDVFPERQELLDERFDIIGFSCMSVQYPDVCEYASELRGAFDGALVVGGVHTTLTRTLPEWADYGIVGEGEQTLLELVAHLSGSGAENICDIDGILFHDGDKVIYTGDRGMIENLDDIPYPAWEMVDMEYYLLPNNVYGTVVGRGLSLMTSRGCCYKCPFCSSIRMWEKLRFHSAKYVVDMIRYVVEKYNVEYIWMADDHFSLNKKRLVEIAELISESGINVGIGISSRVEAYDAEMADILKRIGVKAIALGLETGSDAVLKRIKNGSRMTVAEELAVVKRMKADGMQVHGMFMINTPGETVDDLRRTVEFIHALPLSKVSVAMATPYYATEWWDIALEQGIVKADPNDFDQLRTYNMKTFDSGRPIFKTEIPTDVLKEAYSELSAYGRQLFYFDWKNRGK